MNNNYCVICNNTECILQQVCNTCYNEILDTDITENTSLIKPSLTEKNISQEININEMQKAYFKYYSCLHKKLKIKSCGNFIRYDY